MQAMIPLAGGGYFDIAVPGTHVAGDLSWKNVTLSDTACDASSALKKANDDSDDVFTVYQHGDACHGSPTTSPSLTGSSSQPGARFRNRDLTCSPEKGAR